MIGKRKELGLALGGGGARGLAHVGVLKVFEDESIPIDIIVGTSIGALVGAVFASGKNIDELEKSIDKFLESPTYQKSALKFMSDFESREAGISKKIQALFRSSLLFSQALFRPGILDNEDFKAMIDFFVPDIDIQDTIIPFRAVTTDLVSGNHVVISEGSLREAVKDSCSVPGAMSPQQTSGKLLSDGAITHVVPTTIAKAEGAEFVVAVSVNNKIYSREKLSSALDIYVRAANISRYYLEQHLLKEADVAIIPQVGDLYWADFGHSINLIREGEKAAREKLGLIKKKLFFRRFLP